MASDIDQTLQTPKAQQEEPKKKKTKELTDQAIISQIQSDIRFDEIADKIIRKVPLFVMDDNEEFYLYENGVYKAQNSANLYLKKIVRNEYRLRFRTKNKIKFPDNVIVKIPSPNNGFIHEVIEYIKAYKYVSRQEIDNEQKRYINFKNTLFDIEKWEAIPHTPQIRSIAQVNTNYDPDAKCPKILKYLEECEIDEINSMILAEFSGYCLTTDVKMQKALLLYGVGSNGKSVYILLIRSILGSGLVSNESLHQLEEDKFRVGKLYGKTLNAFPDLKDSPLKSNDMFKMLTGNDIITGEKKRQDSFEFINTAKLLFAANKPPSIGDMGTYAFFRRLIPVEFKHKFEESEIDRYLIDKLTTDEEKSGYVNIMLEGLKRLLTNGDFSYKHTVKETQLLYECQSNNVKVFNDLCLGNCDNLGEEPTEKKELYEYYKTWCEISKLDYVSPTRFTQELKKLGRPVKETSTYEDKVKHTFRFYEDTCFVGFMDINGNDMDTEAVSDGTKEKFEDTLEIEYEDPFPDIPDNIKNIL